MLPPARVQEKRHIVLCGLLAYDPAFTEATALTCVPAGPVCYRTTQRDYNWLRWTKPLHRE
jgi:hypothetical protein